MNQQASGGDAQNSPPPEGQEATSPFNLYQMALPHIIQSNLRVQKLISIEREKQRVQFLFIYF